MATRTLPRTLPRPAQVLEAANHARRAAWDAIWLFVADQGLSWAGAIGLYLFPFGPSAHGRHLMGGTGGHDG